MGTLSTCCSTHASCSVKRCCALPLYSGESPYEQSVCLLQHPNVVRCFAMEEDGEFVYLALERCKGSLHDLLYQQPAAASQLVDPDSGVPTPWCMQVTSCGAETS